MKIFNNTFYKLIHDLAIMSNNVYTYINHSNWIHLENYTVIDITNDINTVKSFHFNNKDTGVNVISFKGTTTLIGLRENENTLENTFSSTYMDKFNDNLYFSCCFYKQSNLFNQSHCNYYINNENICSKSCYKNSIEFSLNYINIAKDIIEKIKDNIDFENVIFTGHSLGGTIATIMGILYNKTSISFESPGDKHYIDLIGLKAHSGTYHFGHDADPIFLGNCGNTCWTFGYNIYTKCHSGYTCTYNAKEKLGYSESILNHRIDYIIKNIIPHWENDFPECVQNTNCSDCESWSYY
jgi:lipase ATG15